MRLDYSLFTTALFASALRLDRGLGALDEILRRRVELSDHFLHVGTAERGDRDLHLLGVGQDLRIAHGGVERLAQHVDRFGARARRQDVGALEDLLADGQLRYPAL